MGDEMPSVVFTSFDGNATTVTVNPGESVMKAAVRNGVKGIVGECGGVLSCASCHVFVDADELDTLPPMKPDEDELLDGTAVDREENSRLSCQLVLDESYGQLRVTTPEFQE
jgi:2Fe-2S ferredoxin